MKKPINKCKYKSFVKIPGVSGYLINKKGEIFSEFKGEVMKPALRSGYHFVVIMTDTGKRVNKMIHRLMAETFLPNPDNLPEIDHIDGNALKPDERLKAHPIDRLHNAGLLEPGEFVVTFAKVLDKRETKLSRAERDVIRTIGMIAFNKTMKKLIADEKARNNSNGDNKQ